MTPQWTIDPPLPGDNPWAVRNEAGEVIAIIGNFPGSNEKTAKLLQETGNRAIKAEIKLQLLRAAFIKHRTATHTLKPDFCETCRESDEILMQTAP